MKLILSDLRWTNMFKLFTICIYTNYLKHDILTYQNYGLQALFYNSFISLSVCCAITKIKSNMRMVSWKKNLTTPQEILKLKNKFHKMTWKPTYPNTDKVRLQNFKLRAFLLQSNHTLSMPGKKCLHPKRTGQTCPVVQVTWYIKTNRSLLFWREDC